MVGVKSAFLSSIVLCSAGVSAFELPFLAEEAREQGYVLPAPFGLSVGGLYVDQGILVDSIGFNGLTLGNAPIASDAVQISAAPGSQHSKVYSVRADAWILPFLNVYAIGGKMSGESSTRVTIDKVELIPGQPLPLPPDSSFDFTLDLDGILYGAGVVVAGGFGNWFTLIDASLTKTELTVIDGEISAFVLSPRLGYDFIEKGLPLRVWVGGMYQHVEQNLSGHLSNLNFDSGLSGILGLLDPNGNGRFDVVQRLQTPWNTLIGFQYQFAKDWSVLGEAGLGDRESAMLSLEYRF